MPGAGLIDHVDRLVGQATPRDVAIGKLDRRSNRVVGDLDAVMRLVAISEAAEDFVGFVDFVEGSTMTTWKRRSSALSFLDVLSILVERRGADALNLAARQCGLEHVRRVDGPFGATGADQACAARR